MPALPVPCSPGQALAWARAQLCPSTDRPRLEAELLLAHVLDRPRPYLIAHPGLRISAPLAEQYLAAVQRRAGGEPLPYITGAIEFFGLPFAVTPDVLIPRPETERLVETALDWITRRDLRTAVDVGTGSGCVAVTLAVHAPALRLFATDISAAALAVARANAAHHGVGDRIACLEGDLLAPLPAPVDLIVGNPPYVGFKTWAADAALAEKK